jgi:2-dehydro-3-deoxygalactonokinase
LCAGARARAPPQGKRIEADVQGLEWIAVDWGTSKLRAWAMGADGSALAEAGSDRGMARLARDEFEGALLALIDKWLPADRKTQVVICGMAGARQGWIEVPYSDAPCAPSAVNDTRAPKTRDPRLAVRIIAGVSQNDPAPDVMRGEETQIAGILGQDPAFDGVICMPGTHTKWVRVGKGQIVRFQTCMTGEMFALLSTQSVLRHSLDGTGWEQDEFERAIQSAYKNPENLAASLFSIRAASLVSGLTAASANARLSGLLIGAELAATRSLWSAHAVTVIDNGMQAERYAKALKVLGCAPSLDAADAVTLAGLRAAYANIVRQCG